MIRFYCFLVFFLLARFVLSQSDFVEKGHNGFEINIGQAFVEGKNPFLAYLGGSINGKLDLGAGLANSSENNLFALSSAYHIGGEKKDLGIAIGAGYIVYPTAKNYFVLGPSFYAKDNAGNLILIPNINFQIATTAEFNFISSAGLSIFTNGSAGLVVRPQFVFGPEQSYFSIVIGLLAHS